MVEINETESKKEKRIKRKEDNLRDLWDNVKCPNIWIIGVPEEDKKKGHEKILEEIIAENFPKEIVIQVQETQRVPNRINPKAKHPKTHINQINRDQTQRKNNKSIRGETTNNTHGDSHRITADLSIKTLQARREWQDTLKVMKENNLQPTLLYPARISFRYEREFKSFTDKQKLRIQHHQTKSSTNAKGLEKILSREGQETQKDCI